MSVLFIGISVFAHAPIMPQNPRSGNAPELLNLRLRLCRKAPCAPFRRWLWCGLGVALVWLCTPESMPSICLQYGLGLALGGLSVQGSRFKVQVQGSGFDVGCSM